MRDTQTPTGKPGKAGGSRSAADIRLHTFAELFLPLSDERGYVEHSEPRTTPGNHEVVTHAGRLVALTVKGAGLRQLPLFAGHRAPYDDPRSQ